MICLIQCLCVSGSCKAILNTNHTHRNRQIRSQHLCYSSAKPANDRVIFDRHNCAGLSGRCNNCLAVNGLERMNLHNLRIDSPGFQCFRGLYSAVQHNSRGNQGNIFSPTLYPICLADLNMIGCFVIDILYSVKRKPDIQRAMELQCLSCQHSGRNSI